MKSKHNMVYNLQNFMQSLKTYSANVKGSAKPAMRIKAGAKVFNVLGIAFVALVLSACASQPFGNADNERSDEAVITERAQARLDALIAGDLPAAWSYTSPGYRQRVSNPMHYSAVVGGSGAWTAAAVDSVTCDSDESCTVRVLITYPLLNGVENTKPLKERWIKFEGEWWIFHRR
ncbi:hypothetical protein [Nitrincola sp. MINF-07-Sa-05]|uniref:hypothetical protein n=1 Tax=Nitrincola salilacus TaxID=3400273 RepID=UPI003918422B